VSPRWAIARESALVEQQIAFYLFFTFRELAVLTDEMATLEMLGHLDLPEIGVTQVSLDLMETRVHPATRDLLVLMVSLVIRVVEDQLE
jgi:hypothetical protein